MRGPLAAIRHSVVRTMALGRRRSDSGGDSGASPLDRRHAQDARPLRKTQDNVFGREGCSRVGRTHVERAGAGVNPLPCPGTPGEKLPSLADWLPQFRRCYCGVVVVSSALAGLARERPKTRWHDDRLPCDGRASPIWHASRSITMIAYDSTEVPSQRSPPASGGIASSASLNHRRENAAERRYRAISIPHGRR